MIQEWDVTKQLVETQLAFKKLQRDYNVCIKRFEILQANYRETASDLQATHRELDELRSELIIWRKKATFSKVCEKHANDNAFKRKLLVEELKKKNADLATQVDTLRSDIKLITRSRDEGLMNLSSEIIKKDEEYIASNVDLTSRLAQAEAAGERLRAENADMEAKFAILRQKLFDADKELGEARLKDVQLQRLSASNEILRREHATLDKTHQTALGHLSRLEAEKEALLGYMLQEGVLAPTFDEQRPANKIYSRSSSSHDERSWDRFWEPPPRRQQEPQGTAENSFTTVSPGRISPTSPIPNNASFASDDVLQDFHTYMKSFR